MIGAIMRSLRKVPPLPPAGNEHGNLSLISAISIAEPGNHLLFFTICQPDVDEYNHRKQPDRKQRRPVHHPFAEQGNEQAGVLGMSYIGIKPFSNQSVFLAGPVHLTPSLNEQADADECDRVAQ